jgi:Predicted secreted protein
MEKHKVKLVLNPIFGLRGHRSYTIKLPSNSSTGYSWKRCERYCPSIIDDSHCYEQYDGPPGTGGVEIWTFTATGKGNETVKLVYSQGGIPEDVRDELEIYFIVG